MMSEDSKALAVLESVRYVDVWEDEEEIKRLANRLKETVPMLAKLKKPENVISAAQYAVLTGANIVRGEMYAYEDWDDNLQIVDGYKMLVRWARRQCNFYEKYVPFTQEQRGSAGLSDKAFAYTCHILREDSVEALERLVQAGVPDAYEIVAHSAVGIVDESDFVVQGGKNRGKYIRPPKGWTWDQVARKRALKNTLNIAYGMPSPREIAQESLMVGNIETRIEDWEDVSGDTPDIRSKEAVLAAATRESKETMSKLTQEEREEWLKEQAFLRGDPDWDPVYSKEDQVVNGETKVVPDGPMLETLEKLEAIMEEVGEGEITDNKHKFQVQRLWEMLGLGLPDWRKDPPTAQSIQATIADKIATEEPEEEPEEEPDEEPVEEEPVEEETADDELDKDEGDAEEDGEE